MKKLLTLFIGVCATLFVANGVSFAAFDGAYTMEIAGVLTVGSIFAIVPSGVLTISLADSQGLVTKKAIATYLERPKVTGFLRSFFPSKVSMTDLISIAVKRGSEFIAVDVARYSDGNRKTSDKSTERLIRPPLYHQYLSVNQHRLYMQVLGALANNDGTFFKELNAELANELEDLVDTINRAIEVQCKQVLEDGIVQLAENVDIDFQRKAASLVAYNVANDFSIGTVSPYEVFKIGAKFIRTKGKSQGGKFNIILGEDAMSAFLENTIVQKRNDIKDFSLDMVHEPQRNATGGTLHGKISFGSNTGFLWTYDEFYDTEAAAENPYVNPKLVIMLPIKPNFMTAFGAVPQLIGKNGKIQQKGELLFQEFFDKKKGSHEQHVKSAPIAVPIAIDQVWTAQVLA